MCRSKISLISQSLNSEGRKKKIQTYAWAKAYILVQVRVALVSGSGLSSDFWQKGVSFCLAPQKKIKKEGSQERAQEAPPPAISHQVNQSTSTGQFWGQMLWQYYCTARMDGTVVQHCQSSWPQHVSAHGRNKGTERRGGGRGWGHYFANLHRNSLSCNGGDSI